MAINDKILNSIQREEKKNLYRPTLQESARLPTPVKDFAETAARKVVHDSLQDASVRRAGDFEDAAKKAARGDTMQEGNLFENEKKGHEVEQDLSAIIEPEEEEVDQSLMIPPPPAGAEDAPPAVLPPGVAFPPPGDAGLVLLPPPPAGFTDSPEKEPLIGEVITTANQLFMHHGPLMEITKLFCMVERLTKKVDPPSLYERGPSAFTPDAPAYQQKEEVRNLSIIKILH